MAMKSLPSSAAAAAAAIVKDFDSSSLPSHKYAVTAPSLVYQFIFF
jgi:hypothetical protein